MFVLICILFTLMGLRQSISGYIETITTSGCENCPLQLTCRHFSSIIAIYHAEFVPFWNELANTTANTTQNKPFLPIHPRQALNHRCSGVHHCSFVLTKDCPGASSWGPGNLTVTYACISADRITKYCNSNISFSGQQEDSDISEGFLHNPGYPRFYSSEKECRWRIKVPSQQLIQLRILDISLTADRTIFPDDCTDHLEIIDSGQLIESVCKSKDPPLEILSGTDSVEVVLVSSHSLVPQRGVFIHYTVVGCPTPQAPQDGHLIYRNDTVAEFRCCVGFVFPDDGERTRIINCRGSFWDAPLPFPNCKRKTLPRPLGGRIIPRDSKMASELIAPALLIVSLFLINFIVLFYIHKLKKKDAIVYANEELGALPVSKVKDEPLP